MVRYKGAIKEVVTLLSGSVLAQVITLVAYFVLLRIYSPADYGLYTIFFSYIEVLVIVSTCKYEVGVVAADNDHSAIALGRFALRLNYIVSLALLAVFSILATLGWLPGKFARLGWLAILISPMVFFIGNNRIFSAIYNRYHRYRAMATSDIVGASSGAVLKTLFGLLGMHSAGMPAGAVLGQASANINYRLGLRRIGLPYTTKAEEREAARHQSNYPRYVAPKDFISSFSANLPFLWLALYFDNAAVGLLAVATTFVIQPCNLIGGVFEKVIYARTAEAVREERPVVKDLARFVIGMMLAALLLAIVLWFFAEPLITLCFGNRWEGCGIYIRALLPWAVAVSGSLPLMFIPNIFGTQRTELYIYLVQLILRSGAILVGIIASDFLLAVRLFAAVSSLTALSLTVWYLAQAARRTSK